MPGSLAHYELLRILGSGSIGVTYRARDLRSGDTVALKLVHPRLAEDPDISVRLRNEARTAAQLRHENIAHVIEADQDGQQTFIASQFVHGVSLRQRLQRAGRLSEAQTHRIALGIAHALNAAHTLRVTHGDLTPDNVLLDAHGDARVCDFALTHALGAQTLTRVVAFIADPVYTAPEVDVRRGDIRSDLYSLGVILYEALTGRPPFDTDSRDAVMRAHVTATPDLAVLQRAARTLAPIVTRLLEKDPRDRYADPAELLDALHAADRLASAVAPDEALAPRLLRPRGTRPRLHVRRHVGEGVGAARTRLAAAGGLAVALASFAAALVVAGASLVARTAVAAARRVRAEPRAVRIAGASAAAVLALGGGGLLIMSAAGGGDGEGPPLVIADEPSPAPTRARVASMTRTTVPSTTTAGAPTTIPGDPPSGTVLGEVVPPAPHDPVGVTRPQSPARTATPPAPAAPTATRASSNPSPTVIAAVPTSTPRPPTSSPTATPVPPSSTPAPTQTRTPTSTSTPGPVSLTLVTDASWSAYATWGGASIGSAQVVCLRRAPVTVPAGCPGNATSFDASSGNWSTNLGPAQWIWAPGLNAGSVGPDGDRFVFERCFDVPGAPSAGLVEIAADRFADVWVNDQRITSIAGPNSAKNVDILPNLNPGENCVAFQAENDFVCGAACTYQQNPAGLIARVSVTYLPN